MDDTGHNEHTPDDTGTAHDGEKIVSSDLDETGNSTENIDVTLRISEDDKPPAYHSDPPPAYSPRDIRRSIRHAKEESSGKVDFARRVFSGICCGTICCGIIIALNLAIPISMIAMGSIYLHSCDRQKYIPIYLVVGGCFGVAKAIIGIVDQALKKTRKKKRTRDDDAPAQKPNPADGVVSCFLLAWFIAGCYWIYSIHEDFQSTDPTDKDTFCNETLYLYAFWLTTATFILMGLGLLCCCALCIGMCIVGSRTQE